MDPTVLKQSGENIKQEVFVRHIPRSFPFPPALSRFVLLYVLSPLWHPWGQWPLSFCHMRSRNTTDERLAGSSITWGVSHVITQCWHQHRRLLDWQKNAPRKTVEIYCTVHIFFFYFDSFHNCFCMLSIICLSYWKREKFKKEPFLSGTFQISTNVIECFSWHGLKYPFIQSGEFQFCQFYPCWQQ